MNYRLAFFQLTVEADTGIVLSCEGASAAALFGAESRDKLVGVPLASLIPNARLPSYDAPVPRNMAKQKLTGTFLFSNSTNHSHLV